MDRALISLCALVVNAAFGGPKRLHDAMGISQLARYPIKVLRDIERKLNREQRSLMERETRGYILVAVVLGSSFLLAWVLETLFGSNLKFFELLVLALVVPVRPTWDIAFCIRKYLQSNNLAAARKCLEGTAWRHHAMLDEQGLARAAIELVVIQFSEKILGVIFWYLLLGLPGIFITVTITMMRDHMTQSPDLELGFGSATWKLHKLLQFVPSRVSGVMWFVVSLFLPNAKWQDMSQIFFSGAGSLPPRSLALVIAGKALNISLGGPGSIYVSQPTMTGPARPMPADIHRALYLFALLHLFLFVVLGLFL